MYSSMVGGRTPNFLDGLTGSTKAGVEVLQDQRSPLHQTNWCESNLQVSRVVLACPNLLEFSIAVFHGHSQRAHRSVSFKVLYRCKLRYERPHHPWMQQICAIFIQVKLLSVDQKAFLHSFFPPALP